MLYKKRSEEQEWLDLDNGTFTQQEYENCLKQLDRIGRYLGGDRATLTALSKMKARPRTILEIGCGGGFFAMRLAETFKEANVAGIDLNERAIAVANRELEKRPELHGRVHFETKDFFQLENVKVDLIIATLTCHHFTDNKIIEFLKISNRFANHAVLINDLHRHPIATVSFFLIAPLFFQNRLIFHDGLISIRRGFIYSDWERYMEHANIPKNRVEINRHLPFRWTVWIQKHSTKS